MPYINDMFFPTEELKTSFQGVLDAIDRYDEEEYQRNEEDAFYLDMANLCM